MPHDGRRREQGRRRETIPEDGVLQPYIGPLYADANQDIFDEATIHR
jgi:hypothetical protein